MTKIRRFKYQIIYTTINGYFLKEYRFDNLIIMFKNRDRDFHDITLILAINDPKDINYCYILGKSKNIALNGDVLSDNMINIIKKRLFVK